MTHDERLALEWRIRTMLANSVDDDSARKILDKRTSWSGRSLMDNVVDDVLHSHNWMAEGRYDDNDIKRAIGKTIVVQIGADFGF